ncbi:HAMP domain-containing protein [Candidatus Microgenomates bacterium]|nr:HAMP domain-containing protein [Candidatus Microgenomates bacterium]
MFKFHSIATKLLFETLLIVGISLVILNLVWINFVLPQKRQDLAQIQLHTAMHAQDKIKDFVFSRQKELATLIEIESFSDLPTERKNELINLILKNDTVVSEIDFLDKNGQELIKISRLRFFSPEEYQNKFNTESFQKASLGNAVISPVYFRDSVPYLSISIPIYDIGRVFTGIVNAEINLSSLWDVFSEIRPSANGYAYVVGEDGILIAHPDLSQVLKNQDVSSRFCVARVLAEMKECSGTEEEASYINENNIEVFAAGVPLKELGWAVMVEIPKSEAFSSINQILRFSAVVIAITLFWVVVISIWYTRRIIVPIKQLEKGAQTIGKGDLNYRLMIKTNDEIEQVANSFNLMAQQLKDSYDMLEKKVDERTVQLTEQNRLLSGLRNLDQAVLSTLEVDELSQIIVDLVYKELGYMFGTIALITPDGKYLRRIAMSRTQNEKLEQSLEIVPIPFKKQLVPLTVTDNALIRAIRERKTIVISKVYEMQKGLFTPDVSEKIEKLLNIKNMHIYPLITKDKVIGIIYYALTLEKEISNVDQAIMQEFANETARALNQALLYQDIKKDREIISAERNKLAVALSGITDAVIGVDLKNNVVIFNTAAQKLTNTSEKEALGRSLDQVITLFDEERVIPLSEYAPIKLNSFEGVIFNKKNVKLIAKDRQAVVDVITGKIKEGVSINLGSILVLHDITEEKKLEEMKLDFVSMAAHELRTPLTSLRGYLSVFMEENKKMFNDEQAMFLNRMNISASQLTSLVENLLNVSRIERGVFTINLEQIDWVSVASGIVDNFQGRAKDRHIKLTFQAPKEPIPKIYADKLRIDEVLSNLISNALAYTKPNGSVTIAIEKSGNDVITHVIDTGQGIPKTAMSHLFTKFFRVSGALESGSKGTGLGLYISKAIIDMHNGKIWVESQVDRGSTFSFSLPIASKVQNGQEKKV